jgi:hypothetical protein
MFDQLGHSAIKFFLTTGGYCWTFIRVRRLRKENFAGICSSLSTSTRDQEPIWSDRGGQIKRRKLRVMPAGTLYCFSHEYGLICSAQEITELTLIWAGTPPKATKTQKHWLGTDIQQKPLCPERRTSLGKNSPVSFGITIVYTLVTGIVSLQKRPTYS